MKQHTAEEIEAKVKEIWTCPDDDYWTEPDSIEVTVAYDHVEIRITAQYESPPMNLPLLIKLGEFLGTMNIDDTRYDRSGCETCDYGSEYGFTLWVTPE